MWALLLCRHCFYAGTAFMQALLLCRHCFYAGTAFMQALLYAGTAFMYMQKLRVTVHP